MGAWGPALFSDDTACDVREDYRECIGNGLSGPEATDRLCLEWQSSIDDPDDGSVFWLALAATQWNCGRLEDRVRVKALEIIAGGENLNRWQDQPQLLKKRKEVLAKLKEQLESPQPPEKRIAKRFCDSCEWEVGEMIGYQLRSGLWVLLRVIHYHSDKGGTSPICELLDWRGEEIPTLDVLQSLLVRRTIPGALTGRPDEVVRFMIGRTSVRELPKERVRRLGIKLEPFQKRPASARVPWPVTVYLWRSLDTALERDFGFV